MRYRAEIDGLRALAVIPVILFHAGFETFSGGFVGVDIFFVISGFLITTILIEDIENQRFSLVHFYERRARRLLPALFFVMFVCLPFAWMWMLPAQMRDFSQSLVAVSLFLSNILFWQETGYFAPSADEKPLLHTWSLAVEEQYYVLFPVFLYLAWRFGKNRLLWLIITITVLSLLLSEWGWRTKETANFYLAPTRVWEILAGSLAAFVVQQKGIKNNNTLAVVGLAAICFSVFFYDDTTPFPSVYALVPVLGAVLLVVYANKATLVAKLLSTRGLVGVGLISYSAYLWHQPLFAFARIRSLEEPSSLLMLSLSLISLILAYFSWIYIERPVRGKREVSRLHIFIPSIVLSASFTAVGLAGHFYPGYFEAKWLGRQPPDVQITYEILSEVNPSTSNWGASDGGVQEITSCIFNVRELDDVIESRILRCTEQHGEGILVLGDSHAIDLFGLIASRREQQFLIGVTRGGCRPHDNLEHCHYNRVLKFISSNPTTFDLVIFEQAGFYLLREGNGNQGSREMFSRLSVSEPVVGVVVDEENVRLTAEFLQDLTEFVNVNWFLPRAEPHISAKIVLSRGCDFEYSYRPNLYETFLLLDEHIVDFTASDTDKGLHVFSQNEMFQFTFPSDFLSCSSAYWSDGDHYSAAGEEYFGRRITPELVERD